MQENFVFSHILNLYDAMLLMIMAMAVLLALPLLLKRDRQTSDLLLAIFLLSQGVFAVHNVMIFSETIGPITYQWFYPFHILPRTVIFGVQGLLLLWYARAMMGQPLGLKSRLTWAGVALTLVMILTNLLATIQFTDAKMLVICCDWFVQMFSVGVGIHLLSRLKGYDKSLEQTHSNIDRHSLTWLRVACLGFVSVWILHLGAMLIGALGFKGIAIAVGTFSNLPPLLLMGAMVVYGQTHAISRPVLTPKTDADEEDDIAYTVNPDLPYRLDDLMLRVKVYQDPELRLEGLADSMDISPRSLSSLLNRHYKKSFYDYVNYYRVLDAQEQLSNSEYRKKSIQRIFEDAGFNSKTTFNTLFKKYTSQTPSEFRKRASRYQLQSS